MQVQFSEDAFELWCWPVIGSLELISRGVGPCLSQEVFVELQGFVWVYKPADNWLPVLWLEEKKKGLQNNQAYVEHLHNTS